ncbi:MAG: hypothetical protein K2O71_01705, partial [Lachnospiraceae bacterium]|nr:hypothetical protein [Lachnospiraceae bacterium]
KYDIEYIYVGTSERRSLNDDTIRGVYDTLVRDETPLLEEVNEELLRSLGSIVFSSDDEISYLIRVSR